MNTRSNRSENIEKETRRERSVKRRTKGGEVTGKTGHIATAAHTSTDRKSQTYAEAKINQNLRKH